MKKLTALCLSLLLTACSSQFAYNNLDWLIHWYLDDYVDLNKSQKGLFDAQFANWHSWHRENELRHYTEQLQAIKLQLQGEAMTAQQVQQHFEQARGHWQRLRQRLTPDIAALAVQLSDAQIASLFAALEEKNVDDEQERLAMDEQEQQQLFEEQYIDRLSDYFGRLTEAQKMLVSDAASKVISNRVEWIRYKREVQKNAQALLVNRAENPLFVEEFSALLNAPEQFQHAIYQQNAQHNRQVFAQLIADVNAILTEKQKLRLFRKIDGYIEDLNELTEDT